MTTQNITIALPVNEAGELVLPVRKIDGEYPINLAKVNADNLARIFLYGATQITNDCHASVKADPETMSDDELLKAHEAVQAAIDKRWDAIYSGEWRVRTAGSGEGLSPVEREALSMARETMRLAYAKAREANKKLVKWGDLDEAVRTTAAKAELEKNRDDYIAKAKAKLADRNAMAKAVDLTAFGL